MGNVTKIVLVGVALAACKADVGPAPAIAEPPKQHAKPAGPTVMVAHYEWVQVQNPNGVGFDHPHGPRMFGETCSVDTGDQVELVAEDGDQALVKLDVEQHGGFGALCREGTLFFMPLAEFRSTTATYEH